MMAAVKGRMLTFAWDKPTGLGIGTMPGVRDRSFYQSLNHILLVSASSFFTSTSCATLA